MIEERKLSPAWRNAIVVYIQTVEAECGTPTPEHMANVAALFSCALRSEGVEPDEWRMRNDGPELVAWRPVAEEPVFAFASDGPVVLH